MRLVTTCHEAGFERYGHRLIKTWQLFPKAELWWYTEGFQLPEDRAESIKELRLESLLELDEFKARHGHYVAPNYLFDVVRFSNKVFAACDALKDYQGIGVWLDADCVARKEIPEGLIESLLEGKFMALLKRKGMYTETGFWVMDCSHPAKDDFLAMWKAWYTTDAFKSLANWTDCETLDATIRRFEKDKRIDTASISGPAEVEMHPLPFTPLGQFIDHLKGARKDLGFSPEGR